MTGPACLDCSPSKEAFTFQCWNCMELHHVHVGAWLQASGGEVFATPCPRCDTVNAIRKPKPTVFKGARLIQVSIQQRMAV